MSHVLCRWLINWRSWRQPSSRWCCWGNDSVPYSGLPCWCSSPESPLSRSALFLLGGGGREKRGEGAHFLNWPNLRRQNQQAWIFEESVACICENTTSTGSLDSLLVERRTRDRKVASSNPGKSGGRIFFSRVNFVCWLLFGIRSTPVLLQWHMKYPGHFAKIAGDRLHVNTHTPLTKRSRSELIFRPGSVHSGSTSWDNCVRVFPDKLRVSSYPNRFPHYVWTADPGLKSGISVPELISASKKKKRTGGELNSRTLPKSSQARKKPPLPRKY